MLDAARNRCYSYERVICDSKAASAWFVSWTVLAGIGRVPAGIRVIHRGKGTEGQMRQTNVKDIRFGRGIVDGVAKGLGRFAVSTMEVPWGLVKDRLGATPGHVIMVRDMAHDYVERMERETPQVDTMVTVGGGQAMDMGKYIADRRGIRLINIPTIVSTNAYVTSTAGLREPDMSVRYYGNISPD